MASHPLTVGTPLGNLVIDHAGGVVTAARFDDDANGGGGGPIADAESASARLSGAVGRYFDGALDALDAVPVAPAGTEYQRRVWAALREIPAGRTTSYGELARQLGSVARAVGAANGQNPIPLFIPCHRVVGVNGDLTGYAFGLERKRRLLVHEGAALL